MGNVINNMPVQMIVVVHTTGDMQPLRFRFEDAEHLINTVEIERILSKQDCNFVGQQCVKYVCEALVEDTKVLFELKYLVLSHKWVLSKMLT